MKVKIIGKGVWGNALYSVVKQNSSTVTFMNRGEKSCDHDIIILAVPTQSIRESLKNLTFSGKHNIVINSAKGIEKNTYLLPSQLIRDVLGKNIEYYSIVGPGFAHEVVAKKPTLVNIGYAKKTTNNKIVKDLFQTDEFRVRLSNGVEALELSAAFKNIYAIACGLAHGLGYEINTRIMLLVLAIEEMETLYKNLHLQVDSNMKAGTLGDLILTCNSYESRNFKFGALLAKNSVKDALDTIQSTIEGYDSLSSIEFFKKKAHVPLPLATFIMQVVQNNDPAQVKKQFEEFVKLI